MVKEVETPYGKMKVKIIKNPHGKTFFHPEYDELKRIAREKGISLREAEQALQSIFSKLND
jgi:uncharacterized protein (DUF111 family)